MIPAVAQIQSSNRVISLLQNNIVKAITNLNSVPLNSGLLLQDIDLAIGDNTVYTGLPAALQGWIVTRLNGASVIYDKQQTNTNPATLILNSSAVVTVDLFVF